MLADEFERIELKRLTEVNPAAVIELMNDPAVRRHLPLARGHFGRSEYKRFLAAKERMWEERGFGPWAFVLDDELVGWGVLQPEGDDADVGLVLSQKYWGAGRVLYGGSDSLATRADELIRLPNCELRCLTRTYIIT